MLPLLVRGRQRSEPTGRRMRRMRMFRNRGRDYCADQRERRKEPKGRTRSESFLELEACGRGKRGPPTGRVGRQPGRTAERGERKLGAYAFDGNDLGACPRYQRSPLASSSRRTMSTPVRMGKSRLGCSLQQPAALCIQLIACALGESTVHVIHAQVTGGGHLQSRFRLAPPNDSYLHLVACTVTELET